MKLASKIDNIQQKVQQLAAKIQGLQLENAALLTENKNIKAELTHQQKLVSELTTKLTNTQQALERKSVDTPESSEKLKEQIDHYIQEIDKCIEWLQKS